MTLTQEVIHIGRSNLAKIHYSVYLLWNFDIENEHKQMCQLLASTFILCIMINAITTDEFMDIAFKVK